MKQEWKPGSADRREAKGTVLPPGVERRRTQRRTSGPSLAVPATPADYQGWLSLRVVLRSLLLESGDPAPTYRHDGTRDLIFESAQATRHKLARVERLIVEYEADHPAQAPAPQPDRSPR